MKLPRRNFLHPAAGAAALPAVSRIATKYIMLVVQVAAGGSPDVFARLVTTALRTAYFRRTDMRLEEHFESSSALQRNERVKLAATFWNNVGAGMVIGGMAAAFFLDKPPGIWTKIGIAIAGFVLGWLCYSIASNLLTYLHTAPEVRH